MDSSGHGLTRVVSIRPAARELSEAINSMFQWYRNCQICYTFLSDVSDGDILDNVDSEFRNSRWFTRGWTLQELLAPHDLRFFSKSWNIIGNRCHLCDLISEVTGIPARYLGPANVAPQPSLALSRIIARIVFSRLA
jgi:hypothetical protein